MIHLQKAEIYNFSIIEKKEFHKRQNDQKGQYAQAQFWENCKKVKVEVPQEPKQ